MKQNTTFAECTHVPRGLGWRTAHASSIGEKGLIYPSGNFHPASCGYDGYDWYTHSFIHDSPNKKLSGAVTSMKTKISMETESSWEAGIHVGKPPMLLQTGAFTQPSSYRHMFSQRNLYTRHFLHTCTPTGRNLYKQIFFTRRHFN